MRRAVLLDAHGTLLELEPPAPRLARILAQRHEIAVGVDDARRALSAEIAYYRAHMNEGTGADSVAALRARCAEVLRRALLPEAPAVAGLGPAEITSALLDSLVFRPFPEVRAALRALRAAGVRAVVVSNWDASLEAVLVKAGLRSDVDAVVSSGAYGAAKPDPSIFAEALRRAGVEREQALHVGDSIDEDVAGARAAGIEPVLLLRDGEGSAPQLPEGGPERVRTIESLSELVVLVAEPPGTSVGAAPG